MLLLFLLGIAIAMLGQAFQYFMLPGQIFEWWRKLLISMISKKKLGIDVKERTPCGFKVKHRNASWLIKTLAYLSKPLGLCPYCNSTWIAIFFFTIYFGFKFELFLVIGIVWFFVYLIERIKKII